MALQSIRKKMNQNQKPFVIGGIVAVCLAVGLVVWEVKPAGVPPAPSSYYFYDTSNGSITTEPAGALPPLKGATGKDTLVRAYMYTCTSCGDKKVGYLMKYTPRAKQALQYLAQPKGPHMTPQQSMAYFSSRAQYESAIPAGTYVRLPAKGSHWHPLMSQAGSAITKPIKCPGNSAGKPCLP